MTYESAGDAASVQSVESITGVLDYGCSCLVEELPISDVRALEPRDRCPMAVTDKILYHRFLVKTILNLRGSCELKERVLRQMIPDSILGVLELRR
jgi:hypothetical protein